MLDASHHTEGRISINRGCGHRISGSVKPRLALMCVPGQRGNFDLVCLLLAVAAVGFRVGRLIAARRLPLMVGIVVAAAAAVAAGRIIAATAASTTTAWVGWLLRRALGRLIIGMAFAAIIASSAGRLGRPAITSTAAG